MTKPMHHEPGSEPPKSVRLATNWVRERPRNIAASTVHGEVDPTSERRVLGCSCVNVPTIWTTSDKNTNAFSQNRTRAKKQHRKKTLWFETMKKVARRFFSLFPFIFTFLIFYFHSFLFLLFTFLVLFTFYFFLFLKKKLFFFTFFYFFLY